MPTLRAKLYRHLETAHSPDGGLSWVNRGIVILILATTVFVVLETEPALRAAAPDFFRIAEWIVMLLFSVEYLARAYAAGEDPRYAGLRGRLRYLVSVWALIDLLAILPFFLTAGAHNAFLMRLLRLLRLLRLARLGRFSRAWIALSDAIHERRFELGLSGALAFLVMLISSSFLYLLEGAAQPEAFGSIPRALWWSVATLTTVGYGDVTPITVFGRIFAGFTAIAGVGLIAMPTGILAAAFSEAMRRQRAEMESRDQ